MVECRWHRVPAALAAVVLMLAGCASSSAEKSLDDMTTKPPTAAELLSADPRFDGEFSAAEQERICSDLASSLPELLGDDDNAKIKFDPDADWACVLSGSGAETTSDIRLRSSPVDEENRVYAAGLLADSHSLSLECQLYRFGDVPVFGLRLIALDSGPLCVEPVEQGAKGNPYVNSAFVAGSRVFNLWVGVEDRDESEVTYLDQALAATAITVAALRDVLDYRSPETGSIPDVSAWSGLCDTALAEAAGTAGIDAEVVSLLPSDRQPRALGCRTEAVERTVDGESFAVYGWIEITPDGDANRQLRDWYRQDDEGRTDEPDPLCRMLMGRELISTVRTAATGSFERCDAVGHYLPGPHENRSILIADDAMIQFGVVAVHREPDGRPYGDSEAAADLTDAINAELTAIITATVTEG